MNGYNTIQIIDNNINDLLIYKPNLIEISNIYPNNLNKVQIQSRDRQQVISIRQQAQFICRNELSDEYIRYAFNKFKNGLAYYNNDILIAFCIWKVREYIHIHLDKYKELYIYLICGRKLDNKLLPRILDDIVHICRKSQIKYIILEPANDTLKQYYMKYGFEEHIAYTGTKFIVLDVSKSRVSYKTKIKLKTKKQKRVNTLSKIV